MSKITNKHLALKKPHANHINHSDLAAIVEIKEEEVENITPTEIETDSSESESDSFFDRINAHPFLQTFNHLSSDEKLADSKTIPLESKKIIIASDDSDSESELDSSDEELPSIVQARKQNSAIIESIDNTQLLGDDSDSDSN